MLVEASRLRYHITRPLAEIIKKHAFDFGLEAKIYSIEAWKEELQQAFDEQLQLFQNALEAN